MIQEVVEEQSSDEDEVDKDLKEIELTYENKNFSERNNAFAKNA